MIRDATNNDLKQLVDMGLRFLRLHYADKLKENPAQIEKTVNDLLLNPDARILIAGNGKTAEGMLAFMVYPHYFSGEKTAIELAWWVEPEARGRLGLELLKYAENAARAMGAVSMQMIAPDKEIERLYGRLNYEHVESTYQKELR